MILAVLTIGFMSCTKDSREDALGMNDLKKKDMVVTPNLVETPQYWDCHCEKCGFGICIPMQGGYYPLSCYDCGELNYAVFGGKFYVTARPICD